jgi:hypothetical protein
MTGVASAAVQGQRILDLPQEGDAGHRRLLLQCPPLLNAPSFKENYGCYPVNESQKLLLKRTDSVDFTVRHRQGHCPTTVAACHHGQELL